MFTTNKYSAVLRCNMDYFLTLRKGRQIYKPAKYESWNVYNNRTTFVV